MASFFSKDRLQRHFPGSVILGAVAALMLFAAPSFGMGPDDEKCLACHKNAMEKPLANGETLSLQIHDQKFGSSVHAMFGCAACHSDIDASKHPSAVMPIESKRAFSVERSKVCATCHTDQATQWSHGVHAALVKAGNPIAPVCTSCHKPHEVTKGAAQAMDTVPCKTCHSEIFDAYSKSVHGVLRGAGLTQAPLCFSCHGAHDVKVPTEGAGLKNTCFGCHKDAEAKHATWLPNSQLHFKVVACVACHSPKAHRKVDLVLYQGNDKDGTSRPLGVPAFEGSHDSTKTGPAGLDAMTLFNVLASLNKPGVEHKTAIRGRLTVASGVEAHQLTTADQAISNCATCHKAGAEAFQSVSISVAGPGGIPEHYDVSKDALRSVLSLNSIGGFYAIGGTRVTLLDALLVLMLMVGFGLPALHLIIRFLAARPGDKQNQTPKEK
ncbi:hypothetical protein FHS83_000738 [Rhizomicrobium palustre]|uniref:Uncharacterized protein n=1 Tax=Rhizomicrobium palustre TaxID=189966 RepID=A0A846MWK7_9PROT|nr:hypothetical protein [Rhizomicrobium palustre]NIK87420.1 hypothetical protein [Rhizomicrobium palustre]